MTLNDFTSLLNATRCGDNEYKARCPAHDDCKPSLHISEGDDGRILIDCKAGCSTEAICAAKRLTIKDLFPDNDESSSKNHDVTYDYHAENGVLVYQKIRKANKDFIQRRPDGNGDWIYNLKGIDPVLYKLPAVLSADTVWIVEGEKDADTLTRHGLVATCTSSGAGTANRKWEPSYTKWLRGKHVLILPDNDEPGAGYAQYFARNLPGDAESIKVLDLHKIWPDIPEKGDVTDWFEVCNDGVKALEAIQKLADTTPEYDMPKFFREDGKFMHNLLGDYLVKRYNVCIVNGALHIYDHGIYRRNYEALHGHMVKLVPGITRAQRSEVYEYLKVSLNTPRKEVAEPRYIPFKSKIYDIETDQYLDYGPDFVFLNRFPFDYKQDAPPAPSITDVIEQIADHDANVLDLLYEAMGNCFYMVNQFRGAVLMYGASGNNGKSTLLGILTQLVGRENASFLSLQDTAECFRLVGVYGKAVNIGDDITSALLPDTSNFKKLVTGEEVIAEQKGQDAFSFKPFAKMFFALNGLPNVADKSSALFGRMLLIPLNHNFATSGTRDVKLKDRIWTDAEMERIVRLSIDGLKRLIAKGDFTRPESVASALLEYETDMNPLLEYLRDLREPDDLINQPIDEAYVKYKAWCEDSGHGKWALTRRQFTKGVCNEMGYKSAPTRLPHREGVVRCFIS